ncbi:condensation domain-containing protein [Streptomyces sp. M19]
MLPADLTAALSELARTRRATLFMVGLTLFAAVLHRWTAQDVVVVGTPASGRDEPGLENTVGLFLNTLPVPTAWADDPAFDEALKRVRSAVGGALAHQRCPFDQLVLELSPARDAQRNPVFQVFFSHVNAPGRCRPWTGSRSRRSNHPPRRPSSNSASPPR